jgi:thiamine transport system substrate-binding protein
MLKTLRLAAAASLVFATIGSAQAEELRVLTHSSFDISKELIAAFEKQSGAHVSIVKAGDAGEALNKLILTKSAPIADVVYGIDNLLIAKADAAGVLVPYTSPSAAAISPELSLGPTLTPVDYGFVALNYDKDAVAKLGKPLPTSLDDLTDATYKDLLVVENPATSSPGLAFLVATIQHYGEPAAWQFWAKLRDNGVLITQGWTEAYEKSFSRYGGSRPYVLSYATSPAAEVFYADKKPTDSPTANLFLAGSSFRQIEGVRLVKNGKNEKLAKAFVDFLVSKQVQADFPTKMWVYPVISGVTLDDTFKYADQPKDSGKFIASDAGQLDRWIKEWSRIVLRNGTPS